MAKKPVKIEETAPVEVAPEFITIEKGDETIAIHPDQLDQHQRLGWQIKE